MVTSVVVRVVLPPTGVNFAFIGIPFGIEIPTPFHSVPLAVDGRKSCLLDQYYF